jgi:hypothetical protein
MEKLFTEGAASDITIVFKRETFEGGKKVMKLHKIILCQMPYFEALFGAQWIESESNSVEINITDENITERCEFTLKKF